MGYDSRKPLAIMGGKRFIIVAASASDPGTMGGNTKIAIEMARHLPRFGWSVVVVVPNGKKTTFTENVSSETGVRYCEISGFPGNDLLRPVSSVRHFMRELSCAFSELGVGKDDVVFAVCNFHYEIVPLVRLKRRLGFTYLPSHFLFSPFIFENLARGYRFPALKYLALWFYERFFFRMAKRAADGFVITNDSDKCHFPEKLRKCVFAFYGGVNVEQIPSVLKEKTRDVVFCSRLHPQKGIDGFLDVWKIVRVACPAARLTVIGNGAPDYESGLKAKAERLGVADSIDWLGYVNNEAKYAIYASAKVFVHPTIFDNNGMVAAEALCSGLPVVMYDLPALRHVYTTGCVKVPFGDKAAFAGEVTRLLSDDGYYASVAPTAGQIAELRAHWDWPARVERFAHWLEGIHG